MTSEGTSGWPDFALRDVAELLVGFAFKSAQFTDEPTDFRLLRGDNVGQGRLRWDGARRWPRGDPSVRRYELRAGDVILAMDRPWIPAGLKFATVANEDLPSLLVQRVACLRARRVMDQRFLGYVIADPSFTVYVRAVQTGTAIPHISGNQISEYRFAVPPLVEQRRIASVLGALDDKIESNRRLSNTLHAVVSLHFEHTFDGAGSQNMGRLSDLVSITMGQSPPGSTYTEDVDAGPCLVQGMGAFGERFPVSDVYTSAPRKMAPAGATLMTVRAPVGAVNVADTEICLGRGVAALEGPAPTYVEFLARSLAGRWSSEESGTIFPAVNAKQIADLAVPIPAQEAIDAFETTARPMAEQLLSLYREAGSLARIRDELLPFLVSGRLRVPDTKDPDEVIEPAVEGLDAGSAAED